MMDNYYDYQNNIYSGLSVDFYLDDNPIGFIQYYHANKVGEDQWSDEIEGTVGIDQFIGEEKYINCGYGTQMIQKFIKKLFASQSITKIITDVDPHNLRAISCYKKAGFKFIKELDTRWLSILDGDERY